MKPCVLLIIAGGIAAYKCLEVIRRLRDHDVDVRVVLTKAGAQFVTPLSLGALTNNRVFTDLFDLDDEREIGHIRLSRDADLIVVAPATADLLAKMAGGHANDLATAVLLATDKPVLAAPAMNPRMWLHPATQRNVDILKRDGIAFTGPEVGEMAERDEAGPGRLVAPDHLVSEILTRLSVTPRTVVASDKPFGLSLGGKHVLVTSGPTHEPIDPVRYIANRSSGKQGHALAAAAYKLGARVTLISGPVTVPPPAGVEVVNVQTANDMHRAVHDHLPADIAIFAAAVADWRAKTSSDKKVKKTGKSPPSFELEENVDILKSVGSLRSGRPQLVIGFAAETHDVESNARKKLKRKKADWIVANDVSHASGVMGGDQNTIHLIRTDGEDTWPKMDKQDVADKLLSEAAQWLSATSKT